MMSIGKNLNQWQRIGVVLSVIWALGAGMNQFGEDSKQAKSIAEHKLELCITVNPDNAKTCYDNFPEDYALYSTGIWVNAAITSIVPIPLAWAFVYLTMGVGRWVARGKKKDKE